MDFKQIWKRLRNVHTDVLAEDIRIVRSHFLNLLAQIHHKGRDANKEIYYESVIDDWMKAEELLTTEKYPETLEFIHGIEKPIIDIAKSLKLEELNKILAAINL